MVVTDPDSTPDALLNAPAGLALLDLVKGLDFTPAALADPLTAFQLATAAMDMINRWDPMTPARLERLAAEIPSLRHVAERLVSTPEMDHWWAPIDRRNQLWSSHAGSPHIEPGLDRASAGPMQRWERYAHKPNPTILTSTATVDDLSSLVIASAVGISDLQPHPHDEIRRLRLTVREDARVYEIKGPTSWAALARRYPTVDPGGHHRPVASDGTLGPGEPEEVVPDWPAVAQDWDGVHVSLGALLTATDVWVTDEMGSSRFWGWDNEGTYWLRWAFDGYIPLPDLVLQGHSWRTPLHLPRSGPMVGS